MKKLILVLSSRLVLFALFQALIATATASWGATHKYWIVTATLTNCVGVFVLSALLGREGSTLRSLWRFDASRWPIDLLIFLGLVLVSLPVILGPSLSLSTWLWGSPEYYHQVLFQPLPAVLIWVLAITYPVTIALAECATYYGYVMPRLALRDPLIGGYGCEAKCG